MKTLNSVMLTLSILLSTNIFAEASQVPKTKISIDSVLNKYIECRTEGKTIGFAQILNNSFKQCTSNDGIDKSYNKKQWVEYMNQTKNLLRNCSTTYSIVENNSNFSIARIEMKYPTFTQIEYVTMNNKDENWTITNVFSTYK